ncbi:MAG: acetolactate decarboxylase, partial [Bacteroidota bacterium]|nr:acetolactate decarboxylase [Bacteroidota bacterium]
MKYTLILFCFFVLATTRCNDAPAKINGVPNEKPNEFYHYSIWTALVNKIYDGNLTVKDAKNKGDIGLGTYNGADGELILIDGIFYQVPSSGEVK